MTDFNSPEAILKALDQHKINVPTWIGAEDSIKAMRFARLATDVDQVRDALEVALRAMIRKLAPKLNLETIVLIIRPGISDNGSLKQFNFARYRSNGFTKTNRSFAAQFEISSEYLDDPQALGLALAYGAVLHVGTATGQRTASSKERRINERGSTLFGELGMKRRADSIKSPIGRIDRLYGYVPTSTAKFLKSFGLDKALAVHGARPEGWTWGELVKAFESISKATSTPSDSIKLECACPPRVDKDGEKTPVTHGGHSNDIQNGFFLTCCVGCRSAWRADVDDKGKIVPTRVDLSEALQAHSVAEKSA